MKNNLSRTNKKKIQLGGVVLDITDEVYLVTKFPDDTYGLVNIRTGESGFSFESLKDVQQNLINANDIIYDKDEVMIMNVGE